MGGVKRPNAVYFVIDAKRKLPGFADRVKAIVWVAHLSKVAGLRFYLVYDEISDLLLPATSENGYPDWRASQDELEYSLSKTKFFSLYKDSRMRQLSKDGSQWHIYNFLASYSPEKFEDNGDLWADEYARLFSPSPFLLQKLNETGLQKGKYIAVHLRFVNSLESFEKGFNETLSTEKQKVLIEQCSSAIREIKEECHCPVVVFSDSKRFLAIIKKEGVIVLDSKNVAHVGMKNGDHEALTKTIVDFYMLSRASKVYSIVGDGMFCSGFATIAERTGYIPFERINV